MTALSEYQRLECAGLWRASADEQRREVIVSFGDATLVFRDSPSERALSHWSLAAVMRLNPGERPALYSPGESAGEELEIDDETMIAAISKVHAIIADRQPHPGRLRGALLCAVALASAAFCFLWLPGALINHTAQVLPNAARAQIGQAILTDLQRLTGSPCTAPDGSLALNQLGERLLGANGGRLVVLPAGVKTAMHLPGNIVVVGRDLLALHESPEVAGGYILAERLRGERLDPLPDALRFAGLRATFHLLTSGELPSGAFHGFGEALLTQPISPLADADLLPRFGRAGFGSTAYAYAIDPSGETVLGLIEADPYGATPAPNPLLNDTDWVALQGICDG
jgi:hypothetical protein